MNKLILCIIGTILLSSCNKSFTLFNSNSERYHLNDLKYDNIAIKSKVKYDGDDQVKVIANIRMKKDSAVWFSLSPGLGIEAARGLINKDSIILIDKINKEYAIRSLHNMFKGFNFDFEIGMIESMIVGNLVWPITNRDHIEKRTGFFVAVQEKGDLRLTSFIGSKSMKLERLLAESISSNNKLTATFSDFEQIDHAVYPKEITFDASYYDTKYKKQKSANITMSHNKVEIDKKNYNLSISIPSKYELKNI
ncbi:DUF4292 domain-containing protein [Reichenbachiella agarivorans]|uniref:DUF4292 domain-containing protein n=1 Tax=Reichenbachiella agarivorans TaxID=2979464 RepID=A0ABY6CRP5_9BACT|nr:DUF4292 domain-containing protein [Reichenbachiella agarivorans]UXP33182.1 DUF4292 domain-containing protein [Reichenbachiella agarivorans]